MIICLERCADLHMAQWMPLPLSFLLAGCPSCRPTNSVKAVKERALKEEHVRGGTCTENLVVWRCSFSNICQQTYRYIACNALNPCWGLSNNKKQYSQCILGTVIYNSATIIHFKGHMNVIFLPRDAMHPRY